MDTLIQPKVLKGFRDSLPQSEILRQDLQEKLTKTFRSYGFVPIDTPVLEYTEILLRKSNGETEKQVFRFEDNGGRDVAMRFDLTVPFARFTAEHKEELYFPFKRYHIAKVWRGEKPQAGRYREFVQCDIDMVGSDSATADFEILNVLKNALNSIGVEKGMYIHVNHRGILNRFLKNLGCEKKSDEIFAWIDKLPKLPEEVKQGLREGHFSDIEVGTQLINLTSTPENPLGFAQEIFDFLDPKQDFISTLNHMEELAGGEAEDTRRVREIYQMMCAAGIQDTFVLNPAITRGLDYYTGIVFETFIEGMSVGSVCSGGRYDNLAGLYMKDKVPGVGGSIGLDRLIAGLEQLGITEEKGSYLDVEIYNLDKDLAIEYQRLASNLRKFGINVEVFPEAKKIGQQYAVTDKKGIKWGILMTKEDCDNGCFTLKNLKTREQNTGLNIEKAAALILAR